MVARWFWEPDVAGSIPVSSIGEEMKVFECFIQEKVPEGGPEARGFVKLYIHAEALRRYLVFEEQTHHGDHRGVIAVVEELQRRILGH